MPEATAQFKIDERQLDQDLKQLDEYLSSGNTRHMENASYCECPTKTIYDVTQSCANVNHDECGIKWMLFRVARDMFELFPPPPL